MAKTTGGPNILNALRETLDSVVTPSVRDTILARALAVAKLDAVPLAQRELEAFLQGPMHGALTQALGVELGHSVATELERITALVRHSGPTPSQARRQANTIRPGKAPSKPPAKAPSKAPTSLGRRRPTRSTLPSPDLAPAGAATAGDKRWAEKERRGLAPTVPASRGTSRRPSERPREPVPSAGAPLPISADYPKGIAQALGVIGSASVEPRPSGRPTVLLASTDPELFRLFQAWLEMRAAVEQTLGATQLLTRLTVVGGPRAVIVLDGKHPGLRALTLAALADELPVGTTVILWGVQPHLHARMCTISAAAEKWLVYAGDATTDEVVAGCSKALR